MEPFILALGQAALVLAGIFTCVMFMAMIVSVVVWSARKMRQMRNL